MSWLKTNTVDTNPLISFSLFPYSFTSSINRRWLIFSSPPKVYIALALHSTRVSGIMRITNKKGDKLSPWKIPLLMLTFAKLSSHEVNSVCQFVIIFLQIRGCCQTFGQVHGFLICRNGEPHHKPSYNKSMPFPDFLQSCSIVLSINNWSLVPLLSFLHPLCSTGSLSFSSRKF